MILIIAEKPSVAGEISKIVGAVKKEKGYYSGPTYLVSWCIGHLIQLAEPDMYDSALKKWSLDTLPIIPEKYQTIISEKTSQQYHILNELMARTDVTELICATDAGREGELIFRLVYDKSGCNKPFKRLWISSMEEKSIIKGLDNMKDGHDYDNLFYAASCRLKADWLLGINLTRLYSQMYAKTLKLGRVQTPTINLIVKRQRDIENFIPKTYYTLIADLGSFKGYTRVNEKKCAQEIISRCQGHEAFVSKVEHKDKRENPPALYDLTSLQRDANRLLGYSASETLEYLQKLYDAKLATYPRTDSRYITADMETPTRSLIDTLLASGIYDSITTGYYDVQKASVTRLVNDSKVTDHHAILPTNTVTKALFDGLADGEKNILRLVLYRLISATYMSHSYKSTKLTLDIEGEAFEATGKEILDDGYRLIDSQLIRIIKYNPDKEDSQNPAENVILPPISEGNAFSVTKIIMEENKTKPPKPYTEDTLLSAMETAGKDILDDELREVMKGRGLGTPATRAEIIENTIRSGYISRVGKGTSTKLMPTETAYTFMDLIPDKIKDPYLTAEWEKQLSNIHNGSISETDFMNDITRFIRTFVDDAKKTHNLLLSDDTNRVFASDRKSIGICPKCGDKVVEYSKSYSCEKGKNGCGFVIWKQILQKNISESQVKKLISQEKSDLIKGFTAKSGKPFDAHLILKEDKTVGFDFPKK